MNFFLISVVIFVILYLLLNWFTKTSSKKISNLIRKLIIFGSIGLALLMIFAGRFIFSLPFLLMILPIVPNCQIAICNDTSFSHLSAGLGIKTIVLMVDTPLIYGSYNKNMYPILPEGETNVTHDTLGKDKINPEEIYNNFKKLLG